MPCTTLPGSRSAPERHPAFRPPAQRQAVLSILAPACLLSALLASGCGKTDTQSPAPASPELGPFQNLTFGGDETFEILTWNVKSFPLAGLSTVRYMAQAIRAMQPDIIALQEVESSALFDSLLVSLRGWTGLRGEGAAYDINLAIIYRTATITPTRPIYEILTGLWEGLPREPLVLECVFGTTPLVVIDNHLKAGGTTSDVERRLEGCQLLMAYIDAHFAADRVILLGDLNDELIEDPPATNVFQCFLDRPDDFVFADLDISRTARQAEWSYPSWPSDIDHILVTDELFGALALPGATARTLRLDDYLSSYLVTVSDHRPVGLRLPLD